ncbi:hypothetical protein GOV06_03840 [Candidatus Woesearchaeota archaeon]|nr:hypothetical protein [Candidatus Woesearchaeota archaeon]
MEYKIVKVRENLYKKLEKTEMPPTSDENGKALLNMNPYPGFKDLGNSSKNRIIGFAIEVYTRGKDSIIYDSSAERLVSDVKSKIEQIVGKIKDKVDNLEKALETL